MFVELVVFTVTTEDVVAVPTNEGSLFRKCFNENWFSSRRGASEWPAKFPKIDKCVKNRFYNQILPILLSFTG